MSDISVCSITPWIVDFCENIPGNNFFVEVPEEWIGDYFNLGHLHEQCPKFQESYSVMMNTNNLCDWDDEGEEFVSYLERCVELLYGVIHARYIISPGGMKAMIEKWKAGEFGKCYSHYCDEQHLLPVGLNYIPNNGMVRVYCPKCDNIYKPVKKVHQDIDGAFFGTEFPHMLFLNYPELRPEPAQKYVPRLWGFKMHQTAVPIQLETEKGTKAIAPAPVNSQPILSDEPMEEENADKKTEKNEDKENVEEQKDQKVDLPKVDSQKVDSQKVDSEKVNSQKVEGKVVDNPKVDNVSDAEEQESMEMEEDDEKKNKRIKSVSAWLMKAEESEDLGSPWQQDDGGMSGGGSSDPVYDCI